MQDDTQNINSKDEELLNKLSSIVKDNAEIKKMVSYKVESTSFIEEFAPATKRPVLKPFFRYSIAAVLVLFAVSILYLLMMPEEKHTSIVKKHIQDTTKTGTETTLSDTAIEHRTKNQKQIKHNSDRDKFRIWEKYDNNQRAFRNDNKERKINDNLLDSYSIPVNKYRSGLYDSLKKILSSLGYEVNETKNGDSNKALETEPQSAYFSKFKNEIPYKIRIENGKEKSIKVKLYEQKKSKNINFPKSKSTVDELYYKELKDRLEKSFKKK